jgi:hypothetical protein
MCADEMRRAHLRTRPGEFALHTAVGSGLPDRTLPGHGTSAALSKLNNKSKATTLLPGRLSKHKGIERLGDDLAGLKHLP